MAHHLLINSTTGGNWLVPEGADPSGLLAMIRRAMEAGEVIDVTVQLPGDPPKNVTLTVNGAAVATVALVSLP